MSKCVVDVIPVTKDRRDDALRFCGVRETLAHLGRAPSPKIHLNIELGIVRLGPDASAVMKPSIIERSIASSGTESLNRKSSTCAVSRFRLQSKDARTMHCLFIRFPMGLQLPDGCLCWQNPKIR
jgi:hypothetical protein